MKPSERLDQHRQEIRDAVARFNAANPRVFGSVARGEDREDSDVDILVDALQTMTLFDLGGLQDALEILLSCRVDLVTAGGLRPALKAKVLQEAERI